MKGNLAMRICPVIAISASALLLSGCTALPVASTTATGPVQGAALSGRVYGGQNPISGAQVYLYAVNTTGYGGPGIAATSSNASKSLLTSATGNPVDGNGNYYVTTGPDGTFTITNDYTCPSTASPVYLYATGGNPGLGSGTNSAAVLIAGVGNCPASGTLSSTSSFMVNEVSTIATAYAFAGFASDPTHISSSGSTKALHGITLAADAVGTLANVSGDGTARIALPSGTGTVPQSEINTLANILGACVNSTGPASTQCSTLFSNAANNGVNAPDTATAALNIAHNPALTTTAIANLFSLQSGFADFQPSLSTAPNDFTIAINQTSGGLSTPLGIAVDGNGAIWVANAGSGTGTTISEFNTNGAPMSDSPISGGGLNGPFLIAVDSNNNVWVTDDNSGTLSYFENNGTAVFASGFGDVSSPIGIAIDTSNDAWVANSCKSACSPENSISEFSDTGSELSPNPAGFTSGGLNEPTDLAIDVSGNVWATNRATGANSITELSSAGAAKSGSPFTGGGLSGPAGIAVDASGNIWVSNAATGANSLSEYDPATGMFLSGSSGYTGGGLDTPVGIAIDGAGNVWLANNGSAFGAENGIDISEFNSNGVAITSSNGYQGGGLSGPFDIAVDSAGNVWVTNVGNSSITKFVGAAVPVVAPIVSNLITPYGASAVNKP